MRPIGVASIMLGCFILGALFGYGLHPLPKKPAAPVSPIIEPMWAPPLDQWQWDRIQCHGDWTPPGWCDYTIRLKEAEMINIPCNWEDPTNVEVQKFLNDEWKIAQKASHPTKKLRPRVCRHIGAVPVVFGNRVGLLCGYYEPSNNTVLAVLDLGVCSDFRCVLVHEYLHAIVGSGHTNFPAMMEKADCHEEETH